MRLVAGGHVRVDPSRRSCGQELHDDRPRRRSAVVLDHVVVVVAARVDEALTGGVVLLHAVAAVRHIGRDRPGDNEDEARPWVLVPAARPPVRGERVVDHIEIGRSVRLELRAPDIGVTRLELELVERRLRERRRRLAGRRRRENGSREDADECQDAYERPKPLGLHASSFCVEDETASTIRMGSSSARSAARSASSLDGASKTKKQSSSSGTWIEWSKLTRVSSSAAERARRSRAARSPARPRARYVSTR